MDRGQPALDNPHARPRVLVTRPLERARGLCQGLSDRGATPILLPTLSLGPAQDLSGLKRAFAEFAEFSWVIFVSAAAARGLRHYWPIGRGWPARTRGIAVGAATATAVVQAGFPDPLRPGQGQDSESILQMPELQSIKGQGVLIVRGNGGRELLAETLRARGATVRYAETYARTPLQQVPREFLRLGRSGRIDLLTSTSNQTLDSLLAATPEADRGWLRTLPLVVSAERQIQHAQEAGFHGIIQLASSSADQAMLEAIFACYGSARRRDSHV